MLASTLPFHVLSCSIPPSRVADLVGRCGWVARIDLSVCSGGVVPSLPAFIHLHSSARHTQPLLVLRVNHRKRFETHTIPLLSRSWLVSSRSHPEWGVTALPPLQVY